MTPLRNSQGELVRNVSTQSLRHDDHDESTVKPLFPAIYFHFRSGKVESQECCFFMC